MKVSLLVPFRSEPGSPRLESWRWLSDRWRALLPEAELVVGTDSGTPFSKTTAVMDAYSRATGDIFVIADADSWCERPALLAGVEAAMRHRLVMPWHTSYRLREQDTATILASDPLGPNPVTREMKGGVTDFRPGPNTAAMVVIISRRSFERVGGMDSRMRGWGSEDVAFALACGTLLGELKILMGDVYALWHPRPRSSNGARVWSDDPGSLNIKLVRRYRQAYRNPAAMTELCREHALTPAAVEAAPGAPRAPKMVRELTLGGTTNGERIVF